MNLNHFLLLCVKKRSKTNNKNRNLEQIYAVLVSIKYILKHLTTEMTYIQNGITNFKMVKRVLCVINLFVVDFVYYL